MYWHQRRSRSLVQDKVSRIVCRSRDPNPRLCIGNRAESYPGAQRSAEQTKQHSGKLCMRRDWYKAHKFIARDTIIVHPGSCLDSTQEIEPVTTGMARHSLNQLCQPVGAFDGTRSVYQTTLPPTWMNEAGWYCWTSSCCWVVGCCVQHSYCEYGIVCFDRSFGFGLWQGLNDFDRRFRQYFPPISHGFHLSQGYGQNLERLRDLCHTFVTPQNRWEALRIQYYFTSRVPQ